MNLDWFLSSACASADPDLFGGETLAARRAAVAVCNHCPVIADCLQWALAHRTTEVVQAGMWWDAYGNPTAIRATRTGKAAPDPLLEGPPPPPLTCEGGHPSSRYRWSSKRCAGDGCRQANTYYEHTAYLRRKSRKQVATSDTEQAA